MNPKSNIQDFFNPAITKYKELLMHPGAIRYAGWDLETLDVAKIHRADYYEVVNGDRKVVRIYQDGTVVAKGNLDASFLSHASSQYASEGQTLINPIALCEFIYNFALFTIKVAEETGATNPQMRYKFKLQGLMSANNQYVLSNSRSLHFYGSEAKAPETDVIEGSFNHAYGSDVKKGFQHRVAYSIVRQIFLHFGYQEDEIPFFSQGSKEFQVDLIKNM